MVWMVFFGAVALLIENKHVTVFSMGGKGILHQILIFIADIMLITFAGIIIIYLWPLIISTFPDRLPASKISPAWAYIGVFIAGILFLITSIYRLFTDAKNLLFSKSKIISLLPWFFPLTTIPSLYFTLLCFAFLLITGLPIAVIVALTGAIGLSSKGVSLIYVPQSMISMISSYTLLAIPLFILTTELLSASGMAERMISFANILVGHLRGGLGYVNILANAMFAAISGSTVADIAALGPILIPEMKKNGYDEEYAAALTSAAALLGPIIPPSIPMIVLGSIIAGVSIGDLFLSGVLVGFLLMLLLTITHYLITRIRKYPRREKIVNKSLFFKSFKDSLLGLLAPIFMLYSLYAGIVTPTEVAALASVYSLFLGLIVMRALSFKKIIKCLINTAKTSALVLFIIGGSNVLKIYFAIEGADKITSGLLSLSMGNQNLFIAGVILIYILAGMILETNANIILLAPLLFPMAQQLGIDPLYFAMLTVYALCVGVLTPPFAMAIFTASSISGIPPSKLFKASTPFIIISILYLIIIAYIPQISLFLPNALK
jgi:tripartite ATP-independent transporter DctM subunit